MLEVQSQEKQAKEAAYIYCKKITLKYILNR
jgi:hypothetical protein